MFIAKLNKTARFAISCKIENLFKIMQPPPQKKKKPKKLFDGVSTGLPLFYIAGYYRNSPGAAFSFGPIGHYNTIFYFNSYIECGMSIPGTNSVV